MYLNLIWYARAFGVNCFSASMMDDDGILDVSVWKYFSAFSAYRLQVNIDYNLDTYLIYTTNV